MTIDLAAYWRRIGWTGQARADLATLTALHAAHVAAIPFEGLDPFLRRPVPLDLAALQEKIIAGPRGGYCFELNTLFQAALEAMGFAVTALGARVRWMSGPEAPLGPREHMLLKVETQEGPHLADVGFGACLLDAPLPFVVGEEHRTPLGVYRITETAGRYALSVRRGGDWRAMYVFDLQPQLPSDLAIGNWYTSTHSAPPFQHVVIVERIRGAARHKLVNRRYIVEGRDGIVESEREITDADDMARLLGEVFGIEAPVADLYARTPA